MVTYIIVVALLKIVIFFVSSMWWWKCSNNFSNVVVWHFLYLHASLFVCSLMVLLLLESFILILYSCLVFLIIFWRSWQCLPPLCLWNIHTSEINQPYWGFKALIFKVLVLQDFELLDWSRLMFFPFNGSLWDLDFHLHANLSNDIFLYFCGSFFPMGFSLFLHLWEFVYGYLIRPRCWEPFFVLFLLELLPMFHLKGGVRVGFFQRLISLWAEYGEL